MEIKNSKRRGPQDKFSTINQAQLEILLREGWTDKQVSKFFGLSEQTFNSYKKKYPDFFNKVREWKTEADGKIEKALFQRGLGYRTKFKKNFVVSDGKEAGSHVEAHDEEVVYPPDTTACIYWLNNRKPDKWSNRVYNMNLNGDADDKDFRDTFFGLYSSGNGNGNGNGNGHGNGNGKKHK